MPIEFSNVTFTYLHYDNPAVCDIDFTIEEGTLTALLGEVGAGKSTILRMMNGLVPNHYPGYMNGTVMVDGIDTEAVEVAELAQVLNMVFDDPVLQIVSLTVRDDVIFGPANLGLSRVEVLNRVAEALETTRLSGYEARNPRTLSGGEQQLLAMAGVLAMRPKYLVLDEPIAMLDPLGKRQVLEAIRKLHEETGLTVVIAESGTDIEPLMEFVHKVIVMDKGRIVTVGDPRQILADQDLVNKTGLRVPQVTEMAYHFGSKNGVVPVTLDEAVSFVRECSISPAASLAQPEDLSPTEKPDELAVEVHNLWHTYPGPPPVDALQGIDLEIKKGEMVALLGQNGSGKTTLSFNLVGALKPTNKDATVKVAGLDVINLPQFDIIQHVNYVFQNPANQLFNDTFEKEVKYGPERLGLPSEEVERRARRALELVGLSHLWEYSTFDIPKSLETLLGLASVLSLEPEVLIVDEPTGGLDLEVGRRVMETLKELNHQGKTIIIITHDMALASRYARRIVVMSEGKILADGSTPSIFSQPDLLAQTMLEPPQITQLGQRLSADGFPNNILTVEEFVSVCSRQISR